MEMEKQNRSPGLRRPAGRQRGFTLVSMALSTLIGGVMIAGGWTAFSDMRTQWKVAHADRVMDQYAAAAMQDLTNIMSWGWGGEQIATGRWKFKVDDIPQENGDLRRGWRNDFQIDMAEFYQLYSRPTEGILYQGQRPGWVQDRAGRRWYRWFGARPARYQLRVMDGRDRMTFEGLELSFSERGLGRFRQPPDPVDQVKQDGLVDITLTLQYRYSATSWFGQGTRLYGNTYIRERSYKTQIHMRNWDVESNPYRESRIAQRDNSGGGGM